MRELVSGDRVGNILAENAKNNAQLLDVADMAAVGENIDYQANNNDTHGVVDAPVGNLANIAEVAAVEIIAAAVETITDVQEHEYEQSSHMTQFNHQLQSIIQQLQLKEDKINELERRIKELEDLYNQSLRIATLENDEVNPSYKLDLAKILIANIDLKC